MLRCNSIFLWEAAISSTETRVGHAAGVAHTCTDLVARVAYFCTTGSAEMIRACACSFALLADLGRQASFIALSQSLHYNAAHHFTRSYQ